MKYGTYFTAAFAAVLLGLAAPASAQWSIGAPGARQAPSGQHRYIYFVFSNPLPGQEAEFNDWYLNTHLGDLVQLAGFTGVQRFLLEVAPQLSPMGYDSGYLAQWDMEDTDIARLRARMKAAIDGGKSRLGPGFNYNPGGWTDAFFRAETPRITRPDGGRPFIPSPTDNKSHRPNRYMFLEFSNPAVGLSAAAYTAALDRRINQVLALPGWMAAQRFTLLTLPPQHFDILGQQMATRLPPHVFPKYLTIWEVEGESAKVVSDTLQAAIRTNQVSVLKAEGTTTEASFWRPISPYVTKGDFER
jgi:hypothetical protein